MSWFGDFSALCSACVPLPTCNLLNATLRTTILDHCLLTPQLGRPSVRDLGTILISLLGIVVVTHRILNKSQQMLAAVGKAISRLLERKIGERARPCRTVEEAKSGRNKQNKHPSCFSFPSLPLLGRTEMAMMYLVYTCVLFLQIFTIGGLFESNGTFLIWASALHLGALVCFFWTLIVNAFIRKFIPGLWRLGCL